MSKWITDRLPTKEDSDSDILGDAERVWVWRKSRWDSQSPEQVFTDCWCDVEPGTPWAPIITLPPPEPYVKPKRRFKVFEEDKQFKIFNIEYSRYCVADLIPTREAAERIAAIFEEVMP